LIANILYNIPEEDFIPYPSTYLEKWGLLPSYPISKNISGCLPFLFAYPIHMKASPNILYNNSGEAFVFILAMG
jgi:hypothetical protein